MVGSDATKIINDYYPKRIICLTEETTEALYLLGEEHRIVGISGYTVRPPRARKEKPRVSAFTSANIEKILSLEPDLVLGFSDLQAEIAATLIQRGVSVYIFNQRSIDEIFSMILQVGAIVGADKKARDWVHAKELDLAALRQKTESTPRAPKVFFEEWNEPLISGIRWVSELIQIAGGHDCFPELASKPLARERIIEDPLEVVRRSPDIIIGSWCGRKFQTRLVRNRPGWQEVPAVKYDQIYEVKSPDILQPGPAALTDGLATLCSIISKWRNTTVLGEDF